MLIVGNHHLLADAEKLFSHAKSKMHTINN